ncbi:SDR family oxidoreductase [Microcella humidisoli]|uniref:SDR family oxidoreductase n=1 Tax=Microcella humidisoli TaxID=2963406 RepID=A0ABY5FW68_9MICO|nr:SDR family oxidoreductase [Microcella humidisoli]UTT62533.1 SDR family oxidoreductase [Microcella humidisoli]UTT62545.1 SDR family oxidoreductase [Microcella humidisoli]
MTRRKSALLTGAGRASSIAHGIAKTLADDGWNLALTTWSPYDLGADFGGGASDVDELEASLTRAGALVVRIEADLSDPAAPAEVVARAARALDGLDALVLSHSHSVDSSILDTSLESFDRHFAVNSRAAWLLIKAFAELGQEWGRIVALTSDAVVHNVPYGASKGALDRIILAAAGELGSQGITANLINPGPIDTGWMTDDIRAALTDRQPTGRLGSPADTANLVRFLLSDEGGWVTGQLLKSDGGFSI